MTIVVITYLSIRYGQVGHESGYKTILCRSSATLTSAYVDIVTTIEKKK